VKQSLVHIALVVRDYDEAIAFYTGKLHFTLIEDTYQPEQDKRWVMVSPELAMVSCEIDLRVGDGYRIVQRAARTRPPSTGTSSTIAIRCSRMASRSA